MAAIKLQASHYRTSCSRHRHLIPNGNVQVCHDSVHPVQPGRDLGVYIDGSMTMRTHINHVLSSCYCALRQIRSIMPSLPSHALNTVVTALVHSRLDYCNVVFASLPACDIQRLQSVLNTMRYRHWLPVKQRVEYKLCMMVHRCLYGDAPTYLVDLITPSATATVTTASLRFFCCYF